MASRYLFKILLAGAGGVGKTTLLRRFTTGMFDSAIKMTIGVDFSVNSVSTKYGDATLQIWDFAGEERFRDMLPRFCTGARGLLLIFDPIRSNTFFELEDWIKIIKTNTKNVPILLLSTKEDIVSKKPDSFFISPDSIDAFMDKENIQEYVRVSSKNGTNVQEAFQKLTEYIIEQNQKM